jgi:hypothetical protein
MQHAFPPIPPQYDVSKWKDHGTFWEYTAPQHDENGNANLDWLAVRFGRVSGTGSGYIIGKGFDTTKTWEELALEICGVKKKEFTEEQLKNMKHGTDNEEVARQNYEIVNNVKADELGFIVPKFNYYIGFSPDGCVDKPDSNGVYGNIEIKCPKRMYQPLLRYCGQEEPDLNDYSHIWGSHFCQMQWGMGITGRGWNDYCVLDTYQGLYFQQRVLFQQTFFNDLYLKTCQFIQQHVQPLLKDSPYPLMPPR